MRDTYRALALACTLALAAWAFPAGAAEPPSPDVVARVNGVPISRQAVERAEVILRDPKDRGSDARAAGASRESLRRALERLIDEELLYQDAVARGISVEEEKVHQVIRRVKDSMPNSEFSQLVVAHWAVKDEIVKTIERDLMIQQLLKAEVLDRVTVSEEDVAAFWRSKQDIFRTGPEVRLEQIILLPGPDGDPEALRERAEAVAAKARSGEDFRALARSHSEGPARLQGGDLGWRSVRHLPPSLEAAVAKAAVGEIIGPVSVPGGLLIAKLLEKRSSRVVPLEQVRDHLARQLRESRLKERHQAFLEELRRRATIERLLGPPAREGSSAPDAPRQRGSSP